MKGLAGGIVLWLLLVLPAGAGPPALCLNTFAGPPLSTPEQTGFYDRVLRTAFDRIGVPVTIGHLPAERSLANANRGIDDGDFPRVAGLEPLYPNLVMVPEKLDDFDFVVFTRGLRLDPVDWSALQPYHVAIVRGWKILEGHLAGVRQLTRVKNQEQLFLLLKNDRVDAVVYACKEGCGLVRQLGIDDAVVLMPPLAMRPMHIYLHKKHAGLVAPLAAALRAMKTDGTYRAISQQALEPFLPKELSGARP